MSDHKDPRREREVRGVIEGLGRDTKDVTKDVKEGLNRFVDGLFKRPGGREILTPEEQSEQRRINEERRLAEARKLKEARENIIRLKTECWEKHKDYIEAEHQYKEYREQFSKDGGILNYIQRFIGFAEYDLVDFSDMEHIKLKCCEQIISGLSNCIQYQLNREKSGAAGSRPAEINEEAFYANLDIDFKNNLTLTACSLIMDALKKKQAFQDNNLNQLHKEFNNNYYKNLWNAVKADLEGLLTFGTEKHDNVDALKAAIRMKSGEINENFKKNGIEFIFFADCTDEGSRDKYFIIMDSCDRVPAVVRKEDNFIYFKGKYMITEEE